MDNAQCLEKQGMVGMVRNCSMIRSFENIIKLITNTLSRKQIASYDRKSQRIFMLPVGKARRLLHSPAHHHPHILRKNDDIAKDLERRDLFDLPDIVFKCDVRNPSPRTGKEDLLAYF